MEIKKELKINCTPQTLWMWLTEIEKIQKWNPSIIEEETLSKGDIKVGFKSRTLILEGKKKNWYENEILKYAPYNLLIVQLSGGNLGANPMKVEYKIQKLNNGVNLKYCSTWQPKGFLLTIMHPIIKVVAQRNANQCLSFLKNLIEEN